MTGGLPAAERDMWRELMAAALDEAARKALEAMMDVQKYKQQSVWVREALDEGKKLGLDEGKKLGLDEGLAAGQVKEARSRRPAGRRGWRNGRLRKSDRVAGCVRRCRRARNAPASRRRAAGWTAG